MQTVRVRANVLEGNDGIDYLFATTTRRYLIVHITGSRQQYASNRQQLIEDIASIKEQEGNW